MGKQATSGVTRLFVLLVVVSLCGAAAHAQAPANDDCADRISLSCPQSTEPGTNIGASNPTVETTPPYCGATPGDFIVWYSVMGNGDDITIDTCSPDTEFDTVINVYRGGCADVPGMTCVVGNDDAAGAPPECDLSGLNRKSRVSWTSLSGVEYFVAVSGRILVTGDFELVIDCAVPVELQRLTVE